VARTTVDTHGPSPEQAQAKREPLERRESARQILTHGTRVGRYLVLNVIGRGGMGVVYAAHDPQLDRQVALKLIRAEDSREEAERLVREAQALAKLDDPHVVAVYDAGEVDGQVFVAMQLVDGENLELALQKRRRTEDVEQVLSWFRDAGRGLAAAHVARLVHRDFKPSNVLIDRRGRVAVTDFGIAREQGRTHDPERRALSSVDKLLGTPKYMAPEQHAMDRATERSDQFSFCVSLWEALFEQHPFVDDKAATSSVEMGIAIFEGKLIAPRKRGRVPRRIFDALERGLQRDPAARWPSMTALLAELEPVRRRARWPYAAAAGVVGVAVAAVFAWPARSSAGSDCETDGDLDAAWPASTRAAIAARIRGGGRPYDDQVADTLLAGVDREVGALRSATREVCSARRERVDEVQLARREACLATRRAELASFASSLAAGSGDAVADYAIDAARLLEPVRVCNGVGAADPPPPGSAPAGADLDARIGHALASLANGAWTDAERELDDTAATAAQQHLFERQARALYLRGAIELAFDEPARDDLQAAARLADANSYNALSALAWIGMLGVATPEELTMVIGIADTTMMRLRDARRSAEVAVAAGIAYARVGNEALGHEYCLSQLQTIEGFADPWPRHEVHLCLAMTMPPDAPSNHAIVSGDLADVERVYGKGHPATADSVRSAGLVQMTDARTAQQDDARRKRDHAVELFRQALDLYQRIYPRGHSAIAITHDLLGRVLRDRGQIADANAEFMAAATEIESHKGLHAHEAADIDFHVALTAPPDQALAWIRAAAKLAEAPDIMVAYATMAADVGQWDEAFLVAKRDLARTENPLDAEQTARVQWALARAIAGQHGDVAEARRFAKLARAALARDADAAVLAAIDSWLALHR
jgi:tetratricopeptide (TPR) repeat protein/predicted Ser/Thr protein kinase